MTDQASPTLTLQQALLTLTHFWEERGCVVTQPFNTEVGAGTMNPATILRTLGPEPWRVAYVEPSVRPDDSRYGENPNRLQTHTQFQVILKPEPGNPQELYLDSLRALGIDLDAHDVRFVEDNWAQPAIGAWGLGWEVWLDGMEITQFTYFQQVGGQNLDPIPVELTYGMERIMMALQGVTSFRDIAYGPGVSYGELFGQVEYEMSRYYLDEADVDATRELFGSYTAEAQRLVEARLPLPAHTFVLKSSHAFNVLDSRGAISTTERARAFATMRRLARDVCRLWAERREEEGHPLLQLDQPFRPLPGVPSSRSAPTGAGAEGSASGADDGAPRTFALEIGVEELPPHVVPATVEQARAAVASGLSASALPHGEVTAAGTPRRVLVTVTDVATSEADTEKVVRGPRVAAAYDDAGHPTKALLGFARGRGVDLAALTRVEVNGAEHVAVVEHVAGRPAVQVLADLVPEVVQSLRAEKNMRWCDPELSFSRAIRWLVALFGDSVVPARVSGLTTGRTTYLHLVGGVAHADVPGADAFAELLAAHDITVDGAARRASVCEQAATLARTVGGTVDLDAESALVDEITNLVEQPHGVLGDFDRSYLELPEHILTTVMRKHQRYLPVRDGAGALLPHFLTFANGACDDDVVRAGNASVLRARYEDALFFFKADLQHTPEQFRSRLGTLLFTDEAGSMDARASRIADVAQSLADLVPDADVDHDVLARAGALAKFDLATQMVVELSSLAGLMAAEYARRAGEPESVATALWEMELPRQAGDALPAHDAGALLSLADRLDLIAAMFGTGARPTGSSDPYGLRRASLGVLAVLRSRPALGGLAVSTALQVAADRLAAQGLTVDPADLEAASAFVRGRLEQQLRDEGVTQPLIEAVAPSTDLPARTDALLAEITAAHADPALRRVVAAVQRAVRIVPPGTEPEVRPAVTPDSADVRLVHALGALAADPREGLAGFVRAADGLVDVVNGFFDDVLVMADDPDVRGARLGLLAALVDLAPAGIDWVALDIALG